VVDKNSKKILCTHFSTGKTHDFALFKKSRLPLARSIRLRVDSGYLGITRFHANSLLPKKTSKHHPLSTQDKENNRELARQRVFNEHIFACLKRFRIISERYRNRRRRFALRFNLIALNCTKGYARGLLSFWVAPLS
jgi:hypothetical protein